VTGAARRHSLTSIACSFPRTANHGSSSVDSPSRALGHDPVGGEGPLALFRGRRGWEPDLGRGHGGL
jgi:hypothetical protein